MGLKGSITLQNGLTASEGYVSLGSGMIQVSRNPTSSLAYRGATETLSEDELAVLSTEGTGKYRMQVFCPIFASQAARESNKDNVGMHGQSWNFNDETNIWSIAYAKLKEVYPNTTDC